MRRFTAHLSIIGAVFSLLLIGGLASDYIQVAAAKTYSPIMGKRSGYLSPVYAHKIYNYSDGEAPVWEDPSVPPSAYTEPLSPVDQKSQDNYEEHMAAAQLQRHSNEVQEGQRVDTVMRRHEDAQEQNIIRSENREIRAGEDPEMVVAAQDSGPFYQKVSDRRLQETDVKALPPQAIGQDDTREEKKEFHHLFLLDSVSDAPPPNKVVRQGARQVSLQTGHDTATSQDNTNDDVSAHAMMTDKEGNPQPVILSSSSKEE